MTFADLTWEDLQEWAGSRVVTRGKSYRRAVEDLCLTADGRLLAWVEGGDRYATAVTLGKAGKLASRCTCPYGFACKHAVAVVLKYLDAIQAKEAVPPAVDGDERLERLAEEEEWDETDGDSDEDGPPSVAPLKRLAARKPAENPETTVGRYLESLSPSALLDFVRELANDLTEVRQRIADRAALQSGDVAKLIGDTRREIEKVSAEPGRTRHWSDESHIPDYSRVQERLESLLASGHPDEVVALGEEILRRGIQQVGMSHDEGETGREIAGCLEVVFRALKSSSKAGAERLLWEIDARLRDHYCILDGIQGPLADRGAFKTADWSVVADELARRMEAVPVAPATRDAVGSDGGYRRQTIMRWLLDALKHAAREQEITAILMREADTTHCYVELVDHLLAATQNEAAEEWARRGFGQTIEKSPGIAWSLEERLRDLAARKSDLPLVASFRAMEFFDRPDVDRYAALQQATATLGLGDTIRPLLLNWLETGSRPDERPAQESPRRGRRKASPSPRATPQPSWPLPPTGLLVPGEKGRYRFFPDTATLIAIAIEERRNDDVLRWYHRESKRGEWGTDYQGDAVAAAVQETHPDEAMAIWKRLAKSHIAKTKPAAYQMAGACLEKMKGVYQRTDRLAEWDRLLSELRVENARKPLLIGVLDGLEGKRSRILKS